MAGTPTPIYPQTLKNIAARIQNSDGTGKVTLYTAGVNGAKIDSLQVISDDTIARTLTLWLSKGGVDYPLVTFGIIVGVGNTAGSSATSFLGNISNSPAPITTGMTLPLDAFGNKYFALEGGCSLKASVSSAVSSGKFLYFTGMGGDF